MGPRAVAIYARISEDRDGDLLGVRRQLTDCRSYAHLKGWPIAAEYVDDDASAYNGKPRPQYMRMLGDIQEGRIDGLVVWHLDRLHRRPIELEEFIAVCDRAGVRHLATVSGDVDLSTHDGRFHARILGAVARKESDDKSRRAIRKHVELAERGRPPGGIRPYGYTAKRVILPAEAAVIREASTRLLAGESLRTVASDLNRRAIPTAKGKTWSGQQLKQILIHPRNAGLRTLRGEVVGPGAWDAILDEPELRRLRALLTDPARRLNRTARRYLLAGMLYCRLCGAKLITRPMRGQPGYACATGPGLSGCGHLAFFAEPLHQFITEAVIQRLDTLQLARAIRQEPHNDREVSELEISIADDQVQLEELAGMYGAREIGPREYLIARRTIADRLALNQAHFARLTRRDPLRSLVGKGDELRSRWPDLNLDQRRTIVGAVLDRVTVSPAIRGLNRFDSGRFEPLWKI